MSYYIFYIAHSLYLFYLVIQGNVIGSTSSFPLQDDSTNSSQHSHLRLVYFTIFLSYDISSTKILYQTAVEIKSCLFYCCLHLSSNIKRLKKYRTQKVGRNT